MWTIALPISVQVSKKTKFLLNLNQYRNTNFHILNKAKVVFKEKVSPLLRHIPKLNGCTLEFTLFPGSNQKCDVSNICSIVEKFFNDAFVECGKLDDDNYTYVPTSRYNFGGVDLNNPRVEVTINPIGEVFPVTSEEETMQITLVQSEIEQAIRAYVTEQINVREGNDITIELKATRGDAGMQAVIDILPAGTAPTPAPKPAAAVPRVGTGLGIKTAVVAAKTPAPTPVAAAPAEDPQGNEEEHADPANTDVNTEGGGTDNEGEGQAEGEAQIEEPAAAPVVKKSLFTGLKKPVNA